MEREKPVVAYCRVSTLEQKRRGYGIEIQIRDVTLFAQGQGLFIRRFYKDKAESGVAEDRKGLRQLIRDCQAGWLQKAAGPKIDFLEDARKKIEYKKFEGEPPQDRT